MLHDVMYSKSYYYYVIMFDWISRVCDCNDSRDDKDLYRELEPEAVLVYSPEPVDPTKLKEFVDQVFVKLVAQTKKHTFGVLTFAYSWWDTVFNENCYVRAESKDFVHRAIKPLLLKLRDNNVHMHVTAHLDQDREYFSWIAHDSDKCYIHDDNCSLHAIKN